LYILKRRRKVNERKEKGKLNNEILILKKIKNIRITSIIKYTCLLIISVTL